MIFALSYPAEFFPPHCKYLKNKGLYCIKWRRMMDESQLADKLRELAGQFGTMAEPQCKKLEMLAKQQFNSPAQVQQCIESIHDSLDHLRLCIKYQLFDLEATRRENKYLRKLIEDMDL